MLYLFKCSVPCDDVFFPLCKIMMERGYECIYLCDHVSKSCPATIIDRLVGSDVTVISSDHFREWHVELRAPFYDGFPQLPEPRYSLFETIQLLKPKKVIYGTHDLASDVNFTNEWDQIGLPFVDVILSPGEPWSTDFRSVHTNVVDVGWYKYVTTLQTIDYTGPIYFPSWIYNWNRLGPEAFCEFAKAVIKARIPIKLPHWVGSSILERYFVEHDVPHIKSSEHSFDYMKDASCIIVDSASGVIFESVILGKIVYFVPYPHQEGLNRIKRYINSRGKQNWRVNVLRNMQTAVDLAVNTISLPLSTEFLFNVDRAIEVITS